MSRLTYTNKPHRGDLLEAWIKARRDEQRPTGEGWSALDDLLDEYRLAADTGESLQPERGYDDVV